MRSRLLTLSIWQSKNLTNCSWYCYHYFWGYPKSPASPKLSQEPSGPASDFTTPELLQLPSPAHRHHRPGQAAFTVAQLPGYLDMSQASGISIPIDFGGDPTQPHLGLGGRRTGVQSQPHFLTLLSLSPLTYQVGIIESASLCCCEHYYGKVPSLGPGTKQGLTKLCLISAQMSEYLAAF